MNLKRVIAIILTLALIVFSIGFSNFTNRNNRLKTLIVKSQSNSQVVDTKGDPYNTIAVLTIDYVITNDTFYSQLMDNLEKIKQNSNVKAVIIKMNTPGGSTYEATRIVNKIKEIKKERKIPFYISMQSMCASAGYYISSVCDKIYALPETTTGSIGVKIASLNYSELLKKIGIKNDDITSGKFKDLGSTTKPMTYEERQIFQTLVDRSYERFVNTVAQGRKMKIEDVKKVADGRIYDGGQALDLHLIDKLGDYQTVLNDVKKDYKMQNPNIVTYEYEKSFDNIFSLLGNIENIQKSDVEKTLDFLSEYNEKYSGRLMYLYGGN